jgi:hypothetical protein
MADQDLKPVESLPKVEATSDVFYPSLPKPFGGAHSALLTAAMRTLRGGCEASVPRLTVIFARTWLGVWQQGVCPIGEGSRSLRNRRVLGEQPVAINDGDSEIDEFAIVYA